ncbi:hypothetical protein GUITHDRAFT_140123 [Guillardia theta CCMP2712]|uniref:M23ase beta-sheet core domain-containing protein n=1 Tax=Guillardia theta (strain CCMP2712) TaxID=905079 RepID=L1J7B1_GUITC|nr:hypothetical protein GUITHDRAFT_140123 [Guillardia theta CCMP2712]EKX43989.1 hypothetical protein GUITHDRAFT_140123 [Guillardia theta CCMP2712]|eukprot:XP_005830969.1 hypothetical protein GUITHDRAFT_140123 [Guillardia theta CCMP2712]
MEEEVTEPAGVKMLPYEELVTGNFVPDFGRGCYVAYHDAEWLEDMFKYSREILGQPKGCSPPDLIIDPDTHLLSAVNARKQRRSMYISVRRRVFSSMGKPLLTTPVREEGGEEHQVTTFVLVMKPMTVMDLCYKSCPLLRRATCCPPVGSRPLAGNLSELMNGRDIQSIIDDLEELPVEKSYASVASFRFPLAGDGPFLCSQGFNGHFTHFFLTTRHAVDLECPVGTEVVAVADGKVAVISQDNQVSGADCKNFLKWNSVLLQLDCGLLVEYVHIKKGSVRFKEGDRVKDGEVICESGDVGFCPKPHLHIQFHDAKLEDHAKAPTIPFKFRVDGSTSKDDYVPVAGRMYNTRGEVGELEAIYGLRS